VGGGNVGGNINRLQNVEDTNIYKYRHTRNRVLYMFQLWSKLLVNGFNRGFFLNDS